MEKRLLGHTTVEVPLVSLGAAPLANLYTEITEEQATATIETALCADITCFDTAPLYGNGLSELRLGRALHDVPRERFVLATKVGRIITSSGEVMFAMSRDGVRRSIDDSLARLGVESIDILHIHDPDAHEREAFDEVFPVLAELRAQGVIRAVSAGMNQWEMLDRFLTYADFDCFMLAGRYTLLEHRASVAFLDRCTERRVGIMLAGVFNSGILATGAQLGAKYNYTDAPHEILEQVHHIEAICTHHGVPLAAAALQFPLRHPAISTLVLGMDAPEQVAENLRWLTLPIPSACWDALHAAGLITLTPLSSPSG